MPKIKVQKKLNTPKPVIQQEYPNFVTGGVVNQQPTPEAQPTGVNTVVTQPADPTQFRQGMEKGTFQEAQEYPNFVTGGVVNQQPQPVPAPVQPQAPEAPRFETAFVGDLPKEQQQEFEPIPAGVTVKKIDGVWSIQDPSGVWHVSPKLTDEDIRRAGIDPTQIPNELNETVRPDAQGRTGAYGQSDFLIKGPVSSEILPHTLQQELGGYRERSRAMQRAGTQLQQQKITPQPMQQVKTQAQAEQKKSEFGNLLEQNFGISAPDPKTVSNPGRTIQDITSEITKSLNLPDYKSRLDEIAKSRTEIMDEKNRKIGEVNDNPWISEAQRSRQVSRVNETYEGKITNKTAEYTLLQSTYDDARQQAEFVTSQAIDIYQGQQQIEQRDRQFYIETAMKVQEAQRQLDKEEAARKKPIEVSQGAVLIDPTTGKVIGRGAPKEENLPASYQEYQLAKKEGFKGTYNDYQTMDANRKRSISTTQNITYGDYTNKQNTFIGKLNDSISKNSTYSKTSSMRNYGDNVIASLSQANGVADIAAINQFQKVIDEGAVTRDQDVKLIQGAQSLANQLKTNIKRLEKGDQLSPEQRNQMQNLVKSLYDTQVKALNKDPYIASKRKEAAQNGVKPEDTILGELGGFTTATNQTKIGSKKVEAAKSKYKITY